MSKSYGYKIFGKSRHWINKVRNSLFLLSCSFYSAYAFASTGAIPTPPSDQQITDGQDFMDVIKNTAKDAVPILFPILELAGIVIALWLIITALQEAKQKGDWGVMKASVFWAAIFIGIVFTLAYEGNQIGSSM